MLEFDWTSIYNFLFIKLKLSDLLNLTQTNNDIKSLKFNYYFGFFSKILNLSFNFLNFNLVLIFIWSFLLNFLKWINDFLSKLNYYSIKQIIIINNFNFNKKFLIRFKKFNEKNHVISIFKRSKLNKNI